MMKNSARYSFRLNDKFPYSEENIPVTVAQSRGAEKGTPDLVGELFQYL